jgi:predicted acyl esterase
VATLANEGIKHQWHSKSMGRHYSHSQTWASEPRSYKDRTAISEWHQIDDSTKDGIQKLHNSRVHVWQPVQLTDHGVNPQYITSCSSLSVDFMFVVEHQSIEIVFDAIGECA